MVIYEHSRYLGFDETSARSIEKQMQDLINLYHHRNLAQEIFDVGYPKYVANQFLQTQFCAFIHTLKKESFDPHPYFNPLRIQWLAKQFNKQQEEVERYFQQLSVLEALKIGEYWDIINNKVHRQIRKIEMPMARAHLISTPTGGASGYKRNFRRK